MNITQNTSRAFDVSALIARGWVPTGDGKLFHPVLRRWRNAPKYNTANDPEIRGAELRIQEAEDGLDEIFDFLSADGNIPFLTGAVSSERMSEARTVLGKLPRRLLAALWTSRRKIEIAEGDTINHPTLGRISGVASYRTAKVAANGEGFELTLLHEIGHLLDGLRRWHDVSNSAEWLKIWRAEKRAGHVPSFADQQIEPAEYFAESFARYWAGSAARAKLSPRVQQFMRELKDDPR